MEKAVENIKYTLKTKKYSTNFKKILHKTSVSVTINLQKNQDRKPARVRAAVRELRAALVKGGIFYCNRIKTKGEFSAKQSAERNHG